MASREASPHDVAQFKDFTQCDDDKLAVAYLREADFDVQAAIETYFERLNSGGQVSRLLPSLPGPDGRRHSTTPTLPRAPIPRPRSVCLAVAVEPSDRIAAFTIVPDDGNLAPTRPPSRSSLSVHMDPQESGVIAPGDESYSRNFGPATRAHYDPAHWSLTVAGAGTTYYIPDIDAVGRVRASGQPVVLKASKDDHLAAFVSILGHIPLARKVLIELGEPLDDYGHNPNWWCGTPIDEPPESGVPAFVHELHRLMAFMRLSTRLFGSVDPLAGLKLTMDGDASLRGDVDHFLTSLSYAAEDTAGGERAAQLMQGLMNGAQPFNCLNLTVDVSDGQNDIYGAIDGTLWADDPDGDVERDRFLVQLPPILVLRVTPLKDQDLEMDVAAELYMDRYMEQNRDRMKQMRRERAECGRLVQTTSANIEKKSFATMNGRRCPVEDVIMESMQIIQRPPPPGAAGESSAVAASADESKKLADRLEALLNRLKGNIKGRMRVAFRDGG
jgi:hypothetical protein